MIPVLFLLAFLAQALKEIGIPSPGVTQGLLLYAGYQFARGGIQMGSGIIVFTFLGSFCGANLIFYLASLGGNPFLAKLERQGLIKREALEKARNKINTYSFMAVSVARSIPGLMVPTSIIAGTMRIPTGKFLAGITFPLTIWIVVITTLGGTFSNLMPPIGIPPNRLVFSLGAFFVVCSLAGILTLTSRKRVNH